MHVALLYIACLLKSNYLHPALGPQLRYHSWFCWPDVVDTHLLHFTAMVEVQSPSYELAQYL